MQLEKYQNLFLPVSILIAGVMIGGAVLWQNNQHQNTTAVVGASQQQPLVQTADISKVKTSGNPFIGNANATITIAYWYDYQCPFCKRNEEDTMPQLIKDYVDTGKVKIVYKDYQFLGQDSQTLGRYSHAVWEIAPDKFYLWHKAVYDNQGTENTGWATKAKILSITTSVLGQENTAKVSQLVATKGAEYQKTMDADKAEGTAMGVTGTPGTIIGKQLVSGAQPYAIFKAAIDETLSQK